MVEFGIHFNYRVECRYNWISCVLTVMIPIAISTFSCSMYDEYFSTLYWIVFLSYTVLHSFAVYGPLLTFTLLLRPLNQRFAALNSLLKYTIFITSTSSKCYFKSTFKSWFLQKSIFEWEFVEWDGQHPRDRSDWNH